jgi:hypothetical protein
MANQSPFPYGIPPAAPRLPQKHPYPDLDIIIKLLEEIRNFTTNFINGFLQYLIPDELMYLVPDFKQRMIPIINQKTHEIIEALLKASPQNDTQIIKQLSDVELSGQSLEFKDRAVRGHMNRLVNFAEKAREGITKGLSQAKTEIIKGLKSVAEPVFKVINSFLGSLKEAVGYLPGVGAAIDVIKQIKEHLDAASTAVKEHKPYVTDTGSPTAPD